MLCIGIDRMMSRLLTQAPRERGASKNPSTSGNIPSSTHSDLRGGEADHPITSEDSLNTDNTGGSNKPTRAEAITM